MLCYRDNIKLDTKAETKVDDIRLKDNKQKSPAKFKKVEELPGFVPDAELSKRGAKYILKKLMTYEECFDQGYIDGFRYDVDPNRMVWVICAKYDKDIKYDGRIF